MFAPAKLCLDQAGHKVIAAAQIWTQVWNLRTEAKEQAIELEVIKLDVRDGIDRQHALTYDIDILVNNAGIMECGTMAEIPIERVRESFETNVFNHLEFTQGFVRKMIKQGHGKVVWVSSMGGLNCTISRSLLRYQACYRSHRLGNERGACTLWCEGCNN